MERGIVMSRIMLPQSEMSLKEGGSAVQTAGVGDTDHALWVTKSMQENDTGGSEGSDCECPWTGCTRSFGSERALKIHHKRAHGVSIAGSRVECSHCGEPKRVQPSHARNQKLFFCDKSCEGTWYQENWSGEDSPNWAGGGVDVDCANCSTTFNVLRAKYELYDHHYCTPVCMAEHYRERMLGENNPFWDGGSVRYYGPSWPVQRQKALERDGFRCQICGRHENELDRSPDVHHIVAFKNFDSHDAANQLGNLVTLCHKHHMQVEGGNVECPAPASPMTPQYVGEEGDES